MQAISMDLRVRIFEARESGESTSEVAERFTVSPAFVRRLMQRHRERGSLEPTRQRHGCLPKLAGQENRLLELNARRPDLNAAEVKRELGLTVARVTVWRMMDRCGLSFKKSRSTPASGSGRT